MSMKIKREVSLPASLRAVLDQNHGMITTAQANGVGVSNERLCLLVKAGSLVRVSFGVYADSDEFVDMMYAIQLRRPAAIYSHETALYLHDLTDRDPLAYAVTVPTGYNATRLRAEGVTVFAIKRELHRLGVVQLPTVFEHTVRAYSMERTICDCLRSRNQMDLAIVTDAVRRYTTRRDKNLTTLMEMATMLGVTTPLRSYLEVLL